MRRLIFVCICTLAVINAFASDLRLFYKQPASNWMNEGLPIGNGFMGAMIYGGVVRDEVQISEESIWAGGPTATGSYNYGNQQGSWQHLPAVRELLAEGKIKEAEKLAQRHFTGKINPATDSGEFGDYGAQQPFGSLFITPLIEDTLCVGYVRELDLQSAVASVSYTRAGIAFSHEYMASYPERLIIARYENNSEHGIDYQVFFESPHRGLREKLKGNLLKIQGAHTGNGLLIAGEILFKTDGRLQKHKEGYIIRKARKIEIYISVATNYKNEYPHYRGGDYGAVNHKAIGSATSSSYEQIKSDHIRDYQSLFNRVSFSLCDSSGQADDIPTDERLYRYSKGAYDPGFESLYFQYGRYLLICSSRPGSMPAHLQGKWNNSMSPPWACDYHMNINLQMIYWPAEVTNLSECHQPLLAYIHALRQPGRITAKEYFNARGWCVHTMNNAYGFTAPGWNFNWGYAPNSAAWLCQHVWSHFLYTDDQTYLKEFAYPLMKEVGEFWLDYLTEDQDHLLVSSPSYSPEHGVVSAGATIDQEIAYDLFTNLLEARPYLSGEDLFLDSIAAARRRLVPLQIGKYGQLQEWKDDLDNPANQHRHVSHLYAVYPGKQILVYKTPALAQAARRSLIYRGEEGTGWSLGWKINLWARLCDGTQSYKMMRNLLVPALGKGARLSGAGSYSNLLCAHPPFQIDGNMGAVAGMTEMLLQSHENVLRLLPALPPSWPQGRISGLKAVGNYTVALEWKDGFLDSVTILSARGGECELSYQGVEVTLNFKPGEEKRIAGSRFLSDL